MKFKKQKLSTEQIKNRNSIYKEITNLLDKYPDNTPVLVIRGHVIELEGDTLNIKEITHYEISGCTFLGTDESLQINR